MDNTIEIEAPLAVVWDVFSDVERWPEWTASVKRLVALDGPGIEVGKRFEIIQPRLPKLMWVVTEVVPGESWTWRQHSPGGTTLASHRLAPVHGDRTAVTQSIAQTGPIGAVLGRLTRRMTTRYLDMEAQGLKARCEHHGRGDASAG